MTKLYQVLIAKCIGRKRYKALANHWLYAIAARGLTFTWFTFTLLWFWSNWTQLASIAHSFRPREIAAGWIAIFVGSSVILGLWESAREWLLSFEFERQPILSSRYLRTIWGTALVVIAVAVVMLLNAPAPDIVYKAF
jgi:Na+-driven multidrug efflux pump